MTPKNPQPATPDAPSPALAEALARLRADLGQHMPPPALWLRVAASVARPARVLQPALAQGGQGPAPTAGGPGARWRTLLGLGAAVVAALWLVWAAGPGRVARPTKSTPLAPPVVSTMHASGFVPVASAERFAELWQGGAQAAPAWVVPTELPRERLAALGLPYDPARAGETVHAELLLHPSGDVLAVRLTR
ncbi:MAG TPA: hypothetical protein VGQ91_01680 [Ideonella sp.]|nr:hypothetical protein [Ideonella sp.]